MSDVEKRLAKLERHALWLLPNEAREKARFHRWSMYSWIGMSLVVALFAALASQHKFHNHFLSIEYKDDDGFISIYDEEVENRTVYALALVLGVVVAVVQKVYLDPGREVMHHIMIQSRDWKWLVTMLLHETSSVLVSMITTFFYFTNIAILLCVLLGRILGSLVVAFGLHMNENGTPGGDTKMRRLGNLAF